MEVIFAMDTPVLQLFREQNIPFKLHTFDYIPQGGTRNSSSSLGIPEHNVIKTLVFQDNHQRGLIVLMHGDCRVDLKALAVQIGAKKISPCSPEVAEEWSGWVVGSTNPFRLKQKMPVYVEQTVFDLEHIWINGGGRGVLVEIEPRVLNQLCDLKNVVCKLK